MTRFFHGPAAGVVLQLKRAPLFLRVVCDNNGEWDALDQLSDEPKPVERIYVYRIVTTPRAVCIDYRDRQGRRRGDRLMAADYHYYEPQPDDATLRDTAAWQVWATETGKTLIAAGKVVLQ